MAASGDVKILDSEVTTLSPADAGQNVGENAKVPILAWNIVVNLLADADPMTAAAVVGVLIILVLTIFGKVGSLFIGLLGGLLLQASFEKKRHNDDFKWSPRLTSEQASVKETSPSREVYLSLIYLIVGFSRRYPTEDEPCAPLFLGPTHSRLCRLVVRSIILRYGIPLRMPPLSRVHRLLLHRPRSIQNPIRNRHVIRHVLIQHPYRLFPRAQSCLRRDGISYRDLRVYTKQSRLGACTND